MDRFLMKLSMGYPTRDEEIEIGKRRVLRGRDEFDVAKVTTPQAILEMQAACEHIRIDDAVFRYVADIIVATRTHPAMLVGSSPRGTLALIKASRAWAAMRGRSFVSPDDVRNIAVPVLAHRVILKPEVRVSGKTNTQIMNDIIKSVKAPTV